MKVYTCFPGGKAKALTMSYDDGKVQDRRLIDIFNKYGIKGSYAKVGSYARDHFGPYAGYAQEYFYIGMSPEYKI